MNGTYFLSCPFFLSLIVVFKENLKALLQATGLGLSMDVLSS